MARPLASTSPHTTCQGMALLRLLEEAPMKLVHLGDEATLANVAKLSVNFLIASLLEALGEAFALLRKSGIEPERSLAIVNDVFQSPVYANYGDMIAHERFSPAHFALELGLK